MDGRGGTEDRASKKEDKESEMQATREDMREEMKEREKNEKEESESNKYESPRHHLDSQLGGTHPQHLLRLLSTLHAHLLAYCTHHQFQEVGIYSSLIVLMAVYKTSFFLLFVCSS